LFDNGLWHTCTTQEDFRYFAMGVDDSIHADGRGSPMTYGIKSLHTTQINVSKDCRSYSCFSEIGPAEVGPTEVGHA
jgi:hypothetical protein